MKGVKSSIKIYFWQPSNTFGVHIFNCSLIKGLLNDTKGFNKRLYLRSKLILMDMTSHVN